jgi:hydroxyacylglutathione hydrolase
MFFKRIHTPELSINTYLIGDESLKICVVIDPPRNPTSCIMAAESAEMKVVGILETHVHADFVSGAKELKHQLRGHPPIYASCLGGKERTAAYADVQVTDRQQIRLGTLCLEAWHTPGHTPEHLMWLVFDYERDLSLPWFAFSGDAVFVGSIGRPDLLGAEKFEELAEKLFETVHQTLAILPDSLEIFPGHGAGSMCGKALGGLECTTLGYERRSNPYFLCDDKPKWPILLKEGLPPIPPYCKRVKELNLKGPPLLESLILSELPANQSLEDLFILDIRHPEVFARFHFKGAINIPMTSSFCRWAGWFIPDQPLLVITDQAGTLSEVVSLLRLLGFDQQIYSMKITPETEKTCRSSDNFCCLTPKELSVRMHEEKEGVLVLDVRSHSEWCKGHIMDARHLELNTLLQEMHALPQDKLIAVVCRSGMRASTAASFLKKFGYKKVANVRGGMEEWKLLKLPCITEES